MLCVENILHHHHHQTYVTLIFALLTFFLLLFALVCKGGLVMESASLGSALDLLLRGDYATAIKVLTALVDGCRVRVVLCCVMFVCVEERYELKINTVFQI